MAVLALLLILAPGCGIFAPASSGDSTQTREAPEPKVVDTISDVDTVHWSYVPETEVAPITERGRVSTSVFKEQYNVVLLVPFDARSFQSVEDRLSSRSARMLQFYTGIRYALDYLIHNVSIHLQIIDTESVPDFAQRVNELEALQNADVIIGPYLSENVEAVAEFAKTNGKILISPWNTAEVTSDNPLYIRLRPSLRVHAQVITADVRSKYDPEDVRLFSRNNRRDTSALKFFQEASRNLSVNDGRPSDLPELLVDDIADPLFGDYLDTLMVTDSLRAFVIPNWYDEPFIIAALARLNFSKADQEVTVYGLPQWMDMLRMDYDYFENLHVHVSSAKPLSYDSPFDQQLRRHYFERVGELPGEDVFYGKDVMLWLSNLLSNAGTLITEGFTDASNGGSTQKFEMIGVLGDDGETIDYYENRFVRILQFHNYRFELAEKY